jgi:tetratricopeptide (TPR) repeat protein
MMEGQRLFDRALYSEARLKFLTALSEAECSGDPSRLPASLTVIGRLYTDMGRFVEAERLQRRALAAVGSDHPLRPIILDNLAAVLCELGDSKTARDFIGRATTIRRRHSERTTVAWV